MSAGLLAASAVFQTWFQVAVDGFVAPGSGETGWAGSGGKAVLAAGVVAVLVGAALLRRRRDEYLKVALFVAGGASFTIALANLADAQSKANAIQSQFGVPADDVKVSVGVGIFLAGLAGLGMVSAGLVMRRRS